MAACTAGLLGGGMGEEPAEGLVLWLPLEGVCLACRRWLSMFDATFMQQALVNYCTQKVDVMNPPNLCGLDQLKLLQHARNAPEGPLILQQHHQTACLIH